MKPLLLLFGPTAAGKTALAIKLAQTYNGEVVNADSRQVYQQMPIMTAMPSAEDLATVPHHLFSFVPPDRAYSVGQYLNDAKAVISGIHDRGKLPVVVGGTGFYLKVLTEGISPIPDVPAEEALRWQDRWAEEGGEKLYALLYKVDPVLATKLKEGDQQRITRALAVQAHTGQPLSMWQGLPAEGGIKARVLKVGLNPPVETLNERIGKRLQGMMAQGLLAEVAALKSAGYTLDMPGLSSIGCDLFYAHLDGALTLEAVTQKFEVKQRQYAKRQRTWLRYQYNAEIMLNRGEISTVVSKKIDEFLS